MAEKAAPKKPPGGGGGSDTTYKFVGTHVQDLADGSMLAIGETVDLGSDDAGLLHNQTLIDDGVLVDVASISTLEGGGEE
jgi:hypothetical protein